MDLIQHHEVLRYEDPDRIFDEEGANAALVKAKRAGKVRYIGFTGHKDPSQRLVFGTMIHPPEELASSIRSRDVGCKAHRRAI